MLRERYSWRGRTVAWTAMGSGPPVVFCHGTPWSSMLWEPYAEALSRDCSVYLWDMPGYGASSKRPEHDVDLGTQSELFADLLTEWGLESPHVVAHDFGGAVSLRAHLLHQRPFRSLMLVDVVALSPWGTPFFRLVRENAAVFSQLPPHAHEGALRAQITSASYLGLAERTLDQLAEPWLTDEGRVAYFRQIAQADERFTDEIEPHLLDLRVPVRIVWGAHDSWIPRSTAEELHARIPGSSLRIVENAGHLVQLDAPVVLADEIRTWIDGSRETTER